jgi:hypothetical protein
VCNIVVSGVFPLPSDEYNSASLYFGRWIFVAFMIMMLLLLLLPVVSLCVVCPLILAPISLLDDDGATHIIQDHRVLIHRYPTTTFKMDVII